MIHFKTIEVHLSNNYITLNYFIYDEKCNAYYVSNKTATTFVAKYEISSDNKWNHTIDFITTSDFLNENIIPEYYDYLPREVDIIVAHNKQYKRKQKINKL